MVDILGIREDDISVVYPGISDNYHRVNGKEMREKLSNGKPYILFLGTVEPRKNLATLLKAFSALEEDVDLVISGHMAWGYLEAIETVDNLSLRERVKFVGFVREEELAALYSGAELFVYPSWYEGFGLPPVEAMACGTPVVSSTGGSLPEVLGEAALYFDPTDVDALKYTLERLLQDDGLKRKLVDSGINRAEKYTWRNCAMGVIDVYRKFI
jgi:glycosyltransferase involved in cell wall biosynthesis